MSNLAPQIKRVVGCAITFIFWIVMVVGVFGCGALWGHYVWK